MSGDTTKIIPPPRRGPRWIDLALAAVAGSLLTVLIIAVVFFGRASLVAPAASGSASPSASTSSSPLPSVSFPSNTAAPRTTEPASSAPVATTAPPTVTPVATPPRPSTPAPTPLPTRTP